MSNEQEDNIPPSSSSSSTSTTQPHPFYDEKTVERESRIRKLFNSLDPDHKGVVTTQDISEACKLPPHTPFKSDILKKQDQEINYDRFKQHVMTKEEELWNIFSAINQKGDDHLRPDELEAALKDSGVQVTKSDIEALVQLIDTG
jgi:solute carrier family 25 phosphate transporter 23/24/25/41